MTGRLTDAQSLVHSKDEPLQLSPLIFGAATFGSSYNNVQVLQNSTVPEETLAAAFRYGINAVDTSVFYSISESILGRVFSNPDFEREFPRSSYYIITKAGRYGVGKDNFDYSRERIIRSVKESCEKMKTSYLDAVYLHDVEFVSEDVGNANSLHFPLQALEESNLNLYGLDEASAPNPRGPGDERILEGARTLFELKEQGIINKVGIAGYPLATLLRLSILISSKIRPLDIVQSYSHHTLQNHALSAYAPKLKQRGKVSQIINASPLSMGLLRSTPPQPWHPAPPEMLQAVRTASEKMMACGTTLEKVALGYGFTSAADGESIPTVVGLSNIDEVESTIQVVRDHFGTNLSEFKLKRDWREVSGLEKEVCEIIKESNYLNWSWSSP